MDPLQSRLMAWLKNAGLEWDDGVPTATLAKRMMAGNRELWKQFVTAFNVGFDPRNNRFYDLTDGKQMDAWSKLVFDGKIPH